LSSTRNQGRNHEGGFVPCVLTFTLRVTEPQGVTPPLILVLVGRDLQTELPPSYRSWARSGRYRGQSFTPGAFLARVARDEFVFFMMLIDFTQLANRTEEQIHGAVADAAAVFDALLDRVPEVEPHEDA
jgi:hypothetical protein